MALKKILFGKKKNEESDGQEEFFRDDFPPVAKQPAKKTASKPAPKEEKPEVKKAEPKKAEAKATEPKKAASPAKSTAKSTAKASEPKKAEQSTKKAPAKNSAPVKKTTETKKPVAKASNANKSTKPATKSSTKIAKTKELSDDSPEVKGAVAVQEGNATANGKWDIRRAKDGRYFFSLYASNHTVIAYSQIYSSISAVMTGINSVIANAPKCEIEDTTLKKVVSLPCPKWEIYLDKAGEYRFRLYAPNGLVICHAAHGYSSKSGCKGGIDSIKRFCVEAKVNKSY